MFFGRPTEPCPCGSGARGGACHLAPRSTRRRRRAELYALGEASDIAALFPCVRPRDAVFDAFARRVAGTLDPLAPGIPSGRVEEGLALLDEPERERIVASWIEPYRDRWQAMLADGGSEIPIERALVAGAVRMAIVDHLPPPRDMLGTLEGGAVRSHPADALAILVWPGSIWSIDEAVCATRFVPADLDFEQRMVSLERHTPGWVGPEHMDRLRSAASRLRAHLPVDGLPRASATTTEGCEEVRCDDGVCAAIAARLLALYATSPGVGRELAAQHRRR